MFKRIDTVFLPVKDLEKAVEWYCETLGMSPLWQMPGVAALKMGETPLTLVQYRFPGYEQPPEADFRFQPVDQVAFNFFALDIEEVHATLKARGVQVGEIIDHGEIKELQFRDPDGNQLACCWFQE